MGRLRGGPEAELVMGYAARLARTGRSVSLGPLEVAEVDAKGAGREAEGVLLRRALPAGAPVVALDERGRMLGSRELASRLGTWRDEGARETVFLIGGADGLCPELRGEADLALSLGAMVWPHRLVRAMLAEQLYRASSILAGTPYHRA